MRITASEIFNTFGAPLEVGQDRGPHHLLHLVGDARDCVDHLVTDRTDQPGRGAGHLRDDRRAMRYVGLPQVVLRHRPSPPAEDVADLLDERFIALQRHAHEIGNDVARDVVLRRPEPTADDDRIAAIERRLQRRFDALPVVAHLHLEVRVDAHQCQLLTDP